MVAKFNQNLIEAYNLKEESKERSVLISNICEKNVEIVKAYYGENSIYCVRLIYTLFTARLHDESDAGSNMCLK